MSKFSDYGEISRWGDFFGQGPLAAAIFRKNFSSLLDNR
jgi:hypothetical protein